jgi:release factor glutamine methyltransferase
MEPDDRTAVRQRGAGLLAEAVEALKRAGVESPELDAEILLAAAAGVERSKLLTGSFALDDHCVGRFRQFVGRRAAREPIAYIVGHQEFYALDFEVNRDVLIPRPETELVVETALKVLRDKPRARVLDIATGSGAIAIAIAVNAPDVAVTATDISASALEVAKRNARRHGCAARIKFLVGDCFAALPCSHQKFDLILSNPPYVRDDEMARLAPEVVRYEPQIALRGGKDGLDFYRRIAAQIGSHLAAGGELIVEVGAGQAADVARALQAGGCRIVQTLRDLAGHERVVRAHLAG